MKNKKLLSLVLVLAFTVALLVGCAPSAPTTSAAPEATPAQAEPAPAATEAKLPKIGVLDRTADEEVHIKFGQSIQAASKEAGIECLYTATGEDMTVIRSTYDSYITQGCDVIVDFLSSLETSQTLAEDCERDGVFFICIDADPASSAYFYGLSNAEAGAALGEYLVNYVGTGMGGKCDMLLLMDSPSHGADVANRTEVPKKMLMEAYDFITEDTVQYLSLSKYDLESIRQTVVDFLTTHADKENIIMISFASSFNDAIYSASKSQGFDDKIHLFSYDGLDATANILKSGEKSITKGEVCSGFNRYGYDVVEIAKKLVSGETVPHASYANAKVMDAGNVNELAP